jgi:hypothetical protein
VIRLSCDACHSQALKNKDLELLILEKDLKIASLEADLMKWEVLFEKIKRLTKDGIHVVNHPSRLLLKDDFLKRAFEILNL